MYRIHWGLGVSLWMGWCLICQWAMGGIKAQSQCTLDNGRCYYHIQLAPSCQEDMSLQTNRLQNDYDAKVNEIQKSLTHVSTDHSQRIADLENKLTNLMGRETGSAVYGGGIIYENSRHRHRHHPKQGKEQFQGNSERRENELLNMLHGQFSGLRKEIAIAQRRIRDQERQLRDTKLKLNKTEEALLDTTKKLIKTEKDLAESKEENWRLRQEIEEKDIELNKTKEKLLETIRKLKETELALAEAQDENAQLREQLRENNLLLETTRKLLANALRKYHELNLRHEVTVEELQNKTVELVSCFKGKTAQFCGFEDEHMCGFEHEDTTSSQFRWRRYRLSTPTPWTGPTADHTCGNKNGFYLLAEASNHGKGTMARVTSPKYQGLEEQCVQFYYHMYGRNVGTLNVYTRVSEEEFIPAWRAFGNQGNVWTSARMPIPQDVARKGYKVIFESLLENGRAGDIAIDDFRVFDGKCYNVRTAAEVRREQLIRSSQNKTSISP